MTITRLCLPESCVQDKNCRGKETRVFSQKRAALPCRKKPGFFFCPVHRAES
ncbi:Uncharacterized protein dnm_032750 [Desulfonema magnum]|uniref:Uncharacterized protein n=1 Tax=Desulfonema magnum TaxID=45655 RepID=A0A975BKS3_9BACT|nr:Uncharacterized protein dnm_032750 [Desulfonema magnum]